MKKKKLQLKELNIKSQLTTLTTDEAKGVKGGLDFLDNNNNNPIIPNLGKKFMWTVTEQRRESHIQIELEVPRK